MQQQGRFSSKPMKTEPVSRFQLATYVVATQQEIAGGNLF